VSRDLVFEIGVEEIPSGPLYAATAQLADLAEEAFKDARLEYADLTTHGAPRRLVLMIDGLAEQQDDLSQSIKGPSVQAAHDDDGRPTKALEGFARSKGVAIEDLMVIESPEGAYVYARIERPGAETVSVLPALLAQLAADLDWPKAQRWGSGTARFIRPVRSLLALFGGEVVPVRFAGLEAGRMVWGHRFLADNPIEVPTAADYLEALERGKVMLDAEERARFIREGVDAAAELVDGLAVTPATTFAEVVNLVEYPTVAVGQFDEAFLRVPREVLETAMESHQRYFPVQRSDGTLSNRFIVVHNGDPERTDAIVAGHERVIRARLADAAFFYDEDLKADMEAWVQRLETSTFHEKLGTLAAKLERIERLTERLATLAGADPAQQAHAARAAHLAKADLVSHAVVEFPSLQGVMGRYYALAAGEQVEVAEAIVEHYRPRFAGDAVPSSLPGMLVSAADKLDTICGIFAIGAGPTGSSDPYALRRSAIGVLAMVLDGGLALRSLDKAIAAALSGYEGVVAGMSAQAVGEVTSAFFRGRLETLLRDRGNDYDIVAAVLAAAADDPSDALARSAALTAFRSSEGGRDLLVAFKRAANLADPAAGDAPDAALMGAEERALLTAVAGTQDQVHTLVGERLYGDALGMLADLRGPVDAFFDTVLVMDEDAAVRANRLSLLNRIVALFGGFADLSLLEG
jgi:glycyl-tRNA synthetase beta chain